MNNPLFGVACGYLAGLLATGKITFEDLEEFLKEGNDNFFTDDSLRICDDLEMTEDFQVLGFAIAVSTLRTKPEIEEERMIAVSDMLYRKISLGSLTVEDIARFCGKPVSFFLELLPARENSLQ